MMIRTQFKELSLPLLGFGTMRLPCTAGGTPADIDREKTAQMVDYAMQHGVNYFDTAYPYHASRSETVIGELLQKYPRDSYFLADKFPGHQIQTSYDPAGVFEKQLKKCGVDYFDFYLLHNVCENSLPTYNDPRWSIIPYFIEQRRAGRIRHLGFSSHAQLDTLRGFLDRWGSEMEFCQIQLNYLDWTLQDARGKYELLTERSIPVWVMEPLRGGKLCGDPAASLVKEDFPDEEPAELAFRFLQSLPNVQMILSGMSEPQQMEQNIGWFAQRRALDEDGRQKLLAIAEKLKNSVPCTGCRYCTEGCPMGLDIPALLAVYNDMRFQHAALVNMYIEALPEDKRPSACIGCGACAAICPQSIDIPAALADLAAHVSSTKSWAKISRERAEEAERA